jgi:hypothetical protein
MNTEGLTEVAVKDAHPVVEQVTETPPELEPAPPAVVAEVPAPAPVPKCFLFSGRPMEVLLTRGLAYLVDFQNN